MLQTLVRYSPHDGVPSSRSSSTQAGPTEVGVRRRPNRKQYESVRPAGVLTTEPTHRSTPMTKQYRRLVAPVTASVLRQMVRAIVDEVDPDRIILFGSHARRDARPDSDLDLIVIEREAFGLERSRIAEVTRLYQALSDFLIPKDILVFSREEVERWRNSINHVLARSLREGVVLYDRP